MRLIPPTGPFLFATLTVLLASQSCTAQPFLSSQPAWGEPTWYPYVIARGDDRARIEATPIEFRPYRPMHFYGNTVRRTYYRGTPVPLPTDVARGTFTTRRRR